jgi:wyosine [tRNA(Phe)-imidazoG37] synthetase (radical SAM superfamily)
VRAALFLADFVSVKLDAPLQEQWQRINRPVAESDFSSILLGLARFREEYDGHLSI